MLASYSVTRVSIWNFMEWFETMLNEKYDMSLQGLKLRFQNFYNIIKIILDYTLELNSLVNNLQLHCSKRYVVFKWEGFG